MKSLATRKLHAMLLLATVAFTANGLATACYAQDQKHDDGVTNSTVPKRDTMERTANPDATDQVQVRRHRDTQWERNINFDGAHLVEADYDWATACYTPIGNCSLANLVPQGSPCVCYFAAAWAYGTAY